MAHCPECSAKIDLDEDEVEEGEIMSCPECEAELEVVSKSPLQLNVLAGEDDADDEEDEDEEDSPDEDEEEEEEEEEEEDEELGADNDEDDS